MSKKFKFYIIENKILKVLILLNQQDIQFLLPYDYSEKEKITNILFYMLCI